MSRLDGLYKTTIVIWTDCNPAHREIDDLAREAMVGDAFCSQQHVEHVTGPGQFPDTDFFGGYEAEEIDEAPDTGA